MEWVEVADTSIKMGLGAVIAAAAAYFSENRTHRLGLLKEEILRRREMLEKVCSAVESVHKPLENAGIGFAWLQDKSSDASEATKEQIFADAIRDARDAVSKANDLQNFGGQMLLCGFPSGAAALERYRTSTIHLSSAIGGLVGGQAGPQRILELVKECAKARLELYGWLHSVYRGDAKPKFPSGYAWKDANEVKP